MGFLNLKREGPLLAWMGEGEGGGVGGFRDPPLDLAIEKCKYLNI